MGGHQSTQSVNSSAKLAATVVQTATQDCINVGSGENIVNVNGNYNVIDGVKQNLSLSINSSCPVLTGQDSTFQAALSNALTNTNASQSVALTEWINNTRNTQESNINNQLQTNLTQSTAQKCLSSLNGANIQNISGSGNVVKNVAQNVSLNVISQCLMKNGQTNNMVSDITNTVNQHSVYKSENPFAFITDALTAISSNVVYTVALIFVALVFFAILYAAFRHHRADEKTLRAEGAKA
jgi:hypothetical protein